MVFPGTKAGCSRVPPQSATLTAQYCYFTDPVRLACLIHATSVRSEPESNSQKKKVYYILFLAFAQTFNCSSRLNLIVSHVSSIACQRSMSPFSGERVHSISNLLSPRQGGILKNFLRHNSTTNHLCQRIVESAVSRIDSSSMSNFVVICFPYF